MTEKYRPQKICDKDCFNCPYDDCINDAMEAADYRESLDGYAVPKTRKQLAIAAQQREYRAANKDAIAAYQREYRAANKDAIAAYQREYRAANRDSIAAKKREYRAANRDAIAAYQRSHYAENPEKVMEAHRKYRKRKRMEETKNERDHH